IEAHTNWGIALADQGKPAEAIEHYRQALNIKPDHGAAHYNWGVVLGQQGKPAEAIEHYRLAVQMRANSADAHNNWGDMLGQQGRLADAVEHFQQALRRGEGSSGATKAFPSGFSGYNGFMVGKSAESVTAVTEAWARSPTAALAEVTGALFDGRSAGFSVPRLTRPLSRTTGCERAS